MRYVLLTIHTFDPNELPYSFLCDSFEEATYILLGFDLPVRSHKMREV